MPIRPARCASCCGGACPGHQGLDDLLRRVRDRQRELRDRGRLDGILEQARALLDTAIGQERAELFPDPSDEARLREAELDALPAGHRAGHQAAGRLRLAVAGGPGDLREAQGPAAPRGAGQPVPRHEAEPAATPTPQAMQRVKDMMAGAQRDARRRRPRHAHAAGLRRLHGAVRRHVPRLTRATSRSWSTRWSAGWRRRSGCCSSLTDAQRDELSGADGAGARGRRAWPPRWPGWPTRCGPAAPTWTSTAWPGEQMTGEDAARPERRHHGAGRAGRPGRAGGRAAPGLPGRPARRHRRGGGPARARPPGRRRHGGAAPDRAGAGAAGVPAAAPTASWSSRPKAVRRLGDTALRRVFAELPEGGTGDHDQRDAGQAGELHRQHPAVELRRRAGDRRPGHGAQRAAPAGPPAGAGPAADGSGSGSRSATSRWRETERRTSAAVCLLVDLSYSMALRGTWGVAKQTALALHALVRSRYPQDAIQVIGFSNYARELRETDLAGLGWDMVQGTNLHHALMLAGRFLDRRPEHEPGRADRDRRRADRAPAPRRAVLVRLAAVAGDARADPGRGGQDDQAPGHPECLHAGRRRPAHRVRRRSGQAQRGPGASGRPGTLGEYVIRDFLRTRRVSRR